MQDSKSKRYNWLKAAIVTRDKALSALQVQREMGLRTPARNDKLLTGILVEFEFFRRNVIPLLNYNDFMQYIEHSINKAEHEEKTCDTTTESYFWQGVLRF